jgi:O-succinylbenzoate synthase
MRVERIVLRKMKMTFKRPFETSFGLQKEKHFILVALHTKDHVGYADCAAMATPWYSEETTVTGWHMLIDFLIPLLFSRDEIAHPEELPRLFSQIRRNNMAKAALDCAVWDLYAKERGIPLAKALGGTRDKVETGVSIGLQESPSALLRSIEQFMAEGYRRIKVKIKPGKDMAFLEAIRRRFGDIVLMADANSAYTLDDIDLLRAMDKLGLIMIEQPLSHDDIVDHAKLQAVMKTRICLDESIHSTEDARKAIELGSTRTINIKVARVGGLTEAKRIHDLCQAHDIPVWCGGMLDSGIARAHNIAIASLPNFTFPGDLPASDRYWEQDIISRPITIDRDSMVDVPTEAGIGFEPVPELIERFTYAKQEIPRP